MDTRLSSFRHNAFRILSLASLIPQPEGQRCGEGRNGMRPKLEEMPDAETGLG